MRAIPVDTTRVNFVFAGSVLPKALYENGTRIEGRFATDDYGQPLFVVDVLLDSEEERAEVIGVTVAAPFAPVLKKWQPVEFESLECGVYVDRRTNQIRQTFRASGIKEAS